jgi:hypothetical protein
MFIIGICCYLSLPKVRREQMHHGWQRFIKFLFITYLLRPSEIVCFADPRPPLLPEAKPRATTAGERPQNTLLSRDLSK